MTMADTIAVMNGGQIEQLGTPTELYERPRDGVRGRLPRRLEPAPRASSTGADSVRLDGGDVASRASVGGRTGRGRGRRPPGEDQARRPATANPLPGRLRDAPTSASRRSSSSRPPAGDVTVYHQNAEAARPMPRRAIDCHLSWSPDSTFVVDHGGVEHDPTHSPAGSCCAAAPRAARLLASRRRWPPAAAARRRGSRDRRRQDARRHAALLELDALHRRQREDEVASDARQFKQKTGVKVDYVEDINDNASFFGKIQGPLSRGQSIDRDIIVLTDNSRYPAC